MPESGPFFDTGGISLERLRRDTPGCSEVLHLNNAGAALMPLPVHRAQVGHLARELMRGGTRAAREAAEDAEGFYSAAAKLLGCGRDEIAFAVSATQAWQTAFHALDLKRGSRVLIGRAEYGSNLMSLYQEARRRGLEIEILPDDAATGSVSLEALAAALERPAGLLAVTHLASTGGAVAPAREIGALARRQGVPFLLDACQTVGQMPVDVKRIGCDMLAATGRKWLRGPRGSGLLYVRGEMLDRLCPPLPDLAGFRWTGPEDFVPRGAARRFEQYEHSLAARIALTQAILYCLEVGPETIWQDVRRLADKLRKDLSAVPGVTLQECGAPLAGIVTFELERMSAAQAAQALAAKGINVSVAEAGAAPLDFAERGLTALLRASPHYYNTEGEIARFCETLRKL
ncbi:aminotransferase class V-fold PLP-dependent enzyme [Telmatospirillum sp. J64-1]|uniref:aminotransferase class V-fold PLP-dependent enzyme n=1 Tax=Telmatospirillum sp. J64-1 TaxID=2502183 RepID=UPI00115F6381|nr:aminotransferase class V-fold PLP-dependent enzyme [Telmatospirillum sp. J64-1]